MLKQSMSLLEYEMMYSAAVTSSASVHDMVRDVVDVESTVTVSTSGVSVTVLNVCNRYYILSHMKTSRGEQEGQASNGNLYTLYSDDS